jgi:hypothetical protein
MDIADGKNLRIADAGKVLTLGYAAVLAAYRGESWFGLAEGIWREPLTRLFSVDVRKTGVSDHA